MAKYGRPIYITENSIATEDDRRRMEFLIDNFEWNRGFAPKFGLVAFDPKTFERKVKPSGRLYGEIAKGNKITEEMMKAYL